MMTISLVITFATSLSAQRVNRQVVIQETQKTLEVMAREGAEKLSLIIEMQWNLLETMAAQDVFVNGTTEQQLDYLRRERDRLGFDEFAIINSKGEAIYTDGTQVNLLDRSHIQRALTGQRSISDVLISRITGDYFVSIQVPLKTSDGTPAALYLRNDGSMINELVKEIQTELQGFAYIVNDFGAFQAYPQKPDIVYQRETLETQARAFPEYEQRRDFIRQAMGEPYGFGSYSVGDEGFFMGYAKVPNTQFTLLAGAAEVDVMQPMAIFRNNFYPIIFTILVFAALTAIFLARNLSRPMLKLEKLFAKAADGDLTVRADFHYKDEIEKAGKSFNRMMEKINELTYYDPVTDLPNHRSIEKKFPEHEKTQFNDNESHSIMVIAADKFGRMNEKYGYHQGNKLLKMIGERIKINLCRGCDLYRGLSDEFIILCSEHAPQETPVKVAESFLNEIHHPFWLDGEEHRISFSVGIAVYPDHGYTEQELLKNAGFAKNIAKENGGRQIQLFDPGTMDQIMNQRQLEADLSLSIEKNELFLEYQPLISLIDGSVKGMEALLRWNHPEYGRVAPDHFIPIAERSGMIRKIGKWVLMEACNQRQKWSEIGIQPGLMAINVSSKHFSSDEFLLEVKEVLRKTGIPAGSLELELTESTVIQDVESSVLKLRILQEEGIRISIDDFGTGYSSLSYLVQFPVNTLKIDRSFIMNLDCGKQNRDIASTIIAMGKTLELSLVAEGIETKEQLLFVQKEECHLGQGYYFSPPISAEKMKKMLLEVDFTVK